MGELNMRLEDHIMKAVQNVDVNVNKEKLLKAIRATDFVDELIDYLFVTCKDDDYITPEVICRKLLKHGLINKYDGQYTTQERRPTYLPRVKGDKDEQQN
jgi:hypothetical protein